MSTARSPPEDAPAADVAAALREAPFVRVRASADGDALAASGLLARALREIDIPFQVRVAKPSPPDTEDGRTVHVGTGGTDLTVPGTDQPASVTAFEIARQLGDESDPVLGLAGVVAAESTVGADGSDTVLDAAQTRGLVERRPGIAVPTADLADGLAHTTLAHAPFSGQLEAGHDALSDLDIPSDRDELSDEDARRVASLLAIDVATAEWATARAGEAVERALHPYAITEGPFATVGGYADVLDAVARERPGTGVALALGHDARDAALTTWQAHAHIVHTALQAATTGRYDGLFVARVEFDDEDEIDLGRTARLGRLRTAARLLRDFRSPEPLVLVVADGAAAAASVEERPLPEIMATAAGRLDETVDAAPATESAASAHYSDAEFDGDVSTFITAFREEVA